MCWSVFMRARAVQEDVEKGGKQARGRPPRAIVLAPTRELANQVRTEGNERCRTGPLLLYMFGLFAC